MSSEWAVRKGQTQIEYDSPGPVCHYGISTDDVISFCLLTITDYSDSVKGVVGVY